MDLMWIYSQENIQETMDFQIWGVPVKYGVAAGKNGLKKTYGG